MTFLHKFFEEKQIPYTHWEIEHNGLLHFIDTDVVIENILIAPEQEKKKITETLRVLDFKNANIVDYLFFLATALVKNYK